MKFVLISILSLVSTIAMADGFRCQGSDFRVKLFNQVQPELGTRNPAVLVVSERGVGTIATLQGDEINKLNSPNTVIYHGQGNGYQNGRFVFVRLEVNKTAEEGGIYAGYHLATLEVNADNASRVATLACNRYLKQGRE